MTSNIRIVRICQECGTEFVAKTTTTKYCGLSCARVNYKKRKRAAALRVSTGRPKAAWGKGTKTPLEQKEILTVKDLAALIGCSKRTAYRLIKDGVVPAVNFGTRMTRINKSAVLDIVSSVERSNNLLKGFDPDKYYTISEVSTKYGMNEGTVYDLIKRESIPKHKIGWNTYLSKELIDNVLQKNGKNY